MTTGNESITLYIEKSNIGFEFFVNTDNPYNFIHPDALYYWMIEPPVVSDWKAPFDFALSPGCNKPTFPCQGIERLSRELVKCNDGIYRTCAKVKIPIKYTDKIYKLDFYIDKTLSCPGIIKKNWINN